MTDFKKIEKKFQAKWEKSKIFQAKEVKKKKFYVLEMYPYPSGSGLHMGHARNYVIGDVYARFKRMNNFNVIYPMGYDSFGLPAENAAIKAKSHPKIFTEKAIKNFIKQQKSLGLSYDWSRLIASHTPEYYKWDQWLFLELLKKGLAYKKKSAVNWCPKCNTVLANEQVINGKCWRHKDTEVQIKELNQWFFKITKYADKLLAGLRKLDWPEDIKIMQKNWIGKSHGTLVNFRLENKEKMPVFTTRPDTLFGVTFMVFAPEHPKVLELVKGTKYEKPVKKFINKVILQEKFTRTAEEREKEGMFIGKYAINPVNNEKIPIYVANFVLMEYGTGFIMAVPAHDQRDFEFAKKYKIPVIRVISKEKPIKSYLMGAENISDHDLKKLNIKIIGKTKEGHRKIEIPKQNLKRYEDLIKEKLTPGFWNEYISREIVFIFKHKNKKIERLVLNKETEEKIDKLAAEFMDESWDKSCVWKWLAENDFYTDLIVHTGEGILVNSGKFNGLNSKAAINKITKYLESRNAGKKTIQFKLRDWLISRQRYWGCPIPIIYCKKCGIVPDNKLPVKLPEKVSFNVKGNPLASIKSFINTKCPKCNGSAKRETDTMDTFIDSAWYFLRYCDPKNKNKIFDTKKANYWMPIDQYIGGKEHATGHLIYFRFITKFLHDLKLLKVDEPAKKLFNHGMVCKGGYVMSKSRGNVVNPMDIINKYSADTLRLFLTFIAMPDKDLEWSDKAIQGTFKFISKLYSLKNKKFTQESKLLSSLLHKTIKQVTEYIEKFQYNLAIIKLMELTDYLYNEEISKNAFEILLKLISPFAPHIAEELWNKKSFISLEKWPKYNSKKINKKVEQEYELIKKTSLDINHILRLIKTKPKTVYLYVIPKELKLFKQAENSLKKKLNLKIKVFAVNDKKKYDPQKKSKKAKPNKPAIYLE